MFSLIFLTSGHVLANAALQAQKGLISADLGQFSRAVFRFTQALEQGNLDQEDRLIVLNNRGVAYKDGGYFYKALNDFNQVLKIDPQRYKTYYLRGITYFLVEEYAKAASDLDLFLSKSTLQQKHHPVLWRYVALLRLRRFKEGKKMLQAYTDLWKKEKAWPAAVGRYYLGALREKELVEQTWHGDRKQRLGQRCQAFFYLAESALALGHEQRAVRWYKKALETKQGWLNELTAAAVGLKAIGQRQYLLQTMPDMD
ncbi:hypothetical protein ACQZV8_04050 [Magnetococcales bacterium HHB-1]